MCAGSIFSFMMIAQPEQLSDVPHKTMKLPCTPVGRMHAGTEQRHDILLLPMARVHALSTPGRRQILHTRNGAMDVVVESECLLVVRPLGPSSYVVPCR